MKSRHFGVTTNVSFELESGTSGYSRLNNGGVLCFFLFLVLLHGVFGALKFGNVRVFGVLYRGWNLLVKLAQVVFPCQSMITIANLG